MQSHNEVISYILGTDTVGCIRIPASFCGIFAFRPSHGVIPMNRVLSNSPSLDTVGKMAHQLTFFFIFLSWIFIRVLFVCHC